MPLTFTDQNFQDEVIDEKGVVFVDFWAPWCGPCKTIGPVVDELAKEYAGKVKIGKINVDENADMAGKYGVMSIPTMIIFKNGQKVDQLVGVHDKEDLKRKIDAASGESRAA